MLQVRADALLWWAVRRVRADSELCTGPHMAWKWGVCGGGGGKQVHLRCCALPGADQSACCLVSAAGLALVGWGTAAAPAGDSRRPPQTLSEVMATD